MAKKENPTPLVERGGAECLLAGDIRTDSTAIVRAQHLVTRHGIPLSRCGLIAALHYGEARQ